MIAALIWMPREQMIFCTLRPALFGSNETGIMQLSPWHSHSAWKKRWFSVTAPGSCCGDGFSCPTLLPPTSKSLFTSKMSISGKNAVVMWKSQAKMSSRASHFPSLARAKGISSHEINEQQVDRPNDWSLHSPEAYFSLKVHFHLGPALNHWFASWYRIKQHFYLTAWDSWEYLT